MYFHEQKNCYTIVILLSTVAGIESNYKGLRKFEYNNKQ